MISGIVHYKEDQFDKIFEHYNLYELDSSIRIHIYHFDKLNLDFIARYPPKDHVFFNAIRPYSLTLKERRCWESHFSIAQKRSLKKIFLNAGFNRKGLPSPGYVENSLDYLMLPTEFSEKALSIFQKTSEEIGHNTLRGQDYSPNTSLTGLERDVVEALNQVSGIERILSSFLNKDRDEICKALLTPNPFTLGYCVNMMENIAPTMEPPSMLNVLSVRLARILKWRYLYNTAKQAIDCNFYRECWFGEPSELEEPLKAETIAFCSEMESQYPYLKESYLEI